MKKSVTKKISYPRIEWVLKEGLPPAEFDIQDKDFKRISWNLAFMIVTN